MSIYTKTNYSFIFRNNQYGFYYFRGTINGNFISKSLKTDKITLARHRADKIMLGADERKQKFRPTFDELFDLVLKIQETKSKATYSMALLQINNHLKPWFKEFCPFLDTFEKNYEEIWADYKLAQKRKHPERKLNHDRRHLIMALRRAFNKQWTRKSIGKAELTLNEAKTSIGKYLEDYEVRKLLDYLKSTPKSYLQVQMAVQMGMRISEILHLKKEEINLKSREIYLDPHRLKIRRPREVPIPIAEDVFPLLVEFYNKAPGEYIFPAIYPHKPGAPVDPNKPQDENRRAWTRARKATGVQARFHDLRHTAITNALAAGMPPISAAKIFGADVRTINNIYDHLKTETKDKFRFLFKGRFT
jgi:integrase